jgi:hypothetical protein
MLHNPQHDLSLLSFRDFAATRDPGERYEYTSRENCACGQFARHLGLQQDWSRASLSEGIWATMNRLAHGMAADAYWTPSGAHTWGELRKRIDAVLG